VLDDCAMLLVFCAPLGSLCSGLALDSELLLDVLEVVRILCVHWYGRHLSDTKS